MYHKNNNQTMWRTFLIEHFLYTFITVEYYLTWSLYY